MKLSGNIMFYEEGGFSLTKNSKKYTLWHYRGALRKINLFSPHYRMSPSVKRRLCIEYATSAIRNKTNFREAVGVEERYKWLIAMFWPLAKI